MQKKKSSGYQCVITIGKRNKKTGIMDEVKWCPDTEYFDNEQLAKHGAATYCLHRLTSHLSTQRLLPPSHKDLWEKFNDLKFAMDEKSQQFNYDPDPFAALENKARSVIEDSITERKNRDARSAAKHDEESPWLKYPPIEIPKELRESLEAAIRANIDLASVEDSAYLNSNDHAKLVKQLQTKGFELVHIKEAMTYRATLQGLIDWLCLHVPEEDLPISMRPVDSSKMEAQNHTTESLSREFIVRRLIATGFSKNMAETALNESQGDEMMAMTRLCWTLVDFAAVEDEAKLSTTELQELIDEEKDVLDSIFDGVDFQTTANGIAFTFKVHLSPVHKESNVQIQISTNSNYPNTPPAVIVTDPSLPAYIRLSLMKNAMAESLNYLASSMIYSIISWLEEMGPGIVSNPPPLVSLKCHNENELTLALNQEKNSNGSKNNKSLKRIRYIDHENVNTSLFQYRNQQLKSKDYLQMLDGRKKLPVYKSRDHILLVYIFVILDPSRKSSCSNLR